MSPFKFLPRRTTREAASSRMNSRTEVCPPSLRQAPDGFGAKILFWLLAPAPLQASPPLNRLPGVRKEFLACLADIHADAAQPSIDRVAKARSLRELWHLRTEIYHLVAIHHSQAEAEARLLRLNRHFPTRAPRSGFAPLLP